MEQPVDWLGVLGSEAAREAARALPIWGAPLVVRKHHPDAALREELHGALGLLPDPAGGPVRVSSEAVLQWPVLCLRSPAALRAVLDRCRAFGAGAELALPAGAPVEIAGSLARPAGEPAWRVATAFDERAIWVFAERAVQVWTVLGTVVERMEVDARSVVRRRLPAPVFGSPGLSAWLEKSDFFLIDPAPAERPAEASFPWGSGLLFSRRRGEQPGGLFWLGALDRARLPSLTASILAGEGGAGALPVGPRGKLTLREWPRWSYRGKELAVAGAWHDWKLLLRAAPAGVWAYVALPEVLDFVAGDLLTWLETLAHDEVVAAGGRLPVEIGMLLGGPRRGPGAREAGARLAGALGLAVDPVRTGPLHESFLSERAWLRVLAPVLGRPFLVARCAAVEDGMAVVDRALSLGSPARVALSSWSASQAELREQLTARGCQVSRSSRLWWSELGAAARG